MASEDVDFDINHGEVLAVVGESGSGKSVSAMSILGLLPPNARVKGSATLQGKELIGAKEATLRAVRGKDIGLIFQEPMTALNPVLTVGFQVNEVLLSHFDLTPQAAQERVIELMTLVDLPDPERPVQPVPAPALRRPAAAHHDRDGAGLRPGAADRRRADDGAGRHGAGRDPGPAQGSAPPAGFGDPVDHPRHGCRRRSRRPGRRHARRPHRRDGNRAQDLFSFRRSRTPRTCWPPSRTSVRGGRSGAAARRRSPTGDTGAGGRRPGAGVPGPRPGAAIPCGRQGELQRAAGRDPRAGRRIRVGQVDDRPRGRQPAAGDRRARSRSPGPTSRACRRAT